jgi:hypothetical protein
MSSGCGASVACLFWVQEVQGSIPCIPTSLINQYFPAFCWIVYILITTLFVFVYKLNEFNNYKFFSSNSGDLLLKIPTFLWVCGIFYFVYQFYVFNYVSKKKVNLNSFTTSQTLSWLYPFTTFIFYVLFDVVLTLLF